MKKPHVYECENGDIWMEFIKSDRRLGLSVDPGDSESGWYYVDKQGNMGSGVFGEEFNKFLQLFLEGEDVKGTVYLDELRTSTDEKPIGEDRNEETHDRYDDERKI